LPAAGALQVRPVRVAAHFLIRRAEGATMGLGVDRSLTIET